MKQLVNASTWWNATEYNAQKQVGGGYMGSSITIDDYRTAQFVSIPSYWKIYLSLDGGRGNTDTLHVRFDYEWAPQPADLGCILIQGLIDIFTSVATPYMKGFGFLGQLAGPPAVC
jgi:hypothetical protein